MHRDCVVILTVTNSLCYLSSSYSLCPLFSSEIELCDLGRADSVSLTSGVFRGRNAVCVGGVDLVEGLPPKNYFCSQNDKFGCILPQFLTGRKHGQSLEALGHGLYGSVVERSLQKQCNSPWMRHCLLLCIKRLCWNSSVMGASVKVMLQYCDLMWMKNVSWNGCER